MGTLDLNRLERERAYHNERFTDETRNDQAKYYYALGDLNRLYEERVLSDASGRDVLEYGCAKGDWSARVAPVARSLHGIDISDVAVDAATRAVKRDGAENCRFSVMNAEAMTFADESFDLVFGSGILHHLDLQKSYSEISRVLRPGGKVVFKEPLGHNVFINAYRAVTPSARTPDEHPMLKGDFELAQRYFVNVKLDFFGLTTLGCVPLRNTPMAKQSYWLASSLDQILFRVPGLRWQAWYVLMTMEKSSQVGASRPSDLEA